MSRSAPSARKPAANAQGVTHLYISGEEPKRAKEMAQHAKDSGCYNPIVSQAQRRAMYAAAAGHSTLGIPQKVGKDFVAAGPASSHLPKRKRKRGY